MEVFISWSGDSSRRLASVLRDFLQDVIQTSRPFMSKHDIDAGARWPAEISNALSKTNVGIVCLTPDNLDSRWLHFEAGALAKLLDQSYLCTCLLGVTPSDIEWPLAQFQANVADKTGITQIVETVNQALGEETLSSDRLSRAFDAYWPAAQKKIAAIALEKPNVDDEQSRNDRDILLEILGLVRGMQRRASYPVLLVEDDEKQVKRYDEILKSLNITPQSTTSLHSSVEFLKRAAKFAEEKKKSKEADSADEDDIPENFNPEDV